MLNNQLRFHEDLQLIVGLNDKLYNCDDAEERQMHCFSVVTHSSHLVNATYGGYVKQSSTMHSCGSSTPYVYICTKFQLSAVTILLPLREGNVFNFDRPLCAWGGWGLTQTYFQSCLSTVGRGGLTQTGFLFKHVQS